MRLSADQKRGIERIFKEVRDSMTWSYAATFWGCALIGWPSHNLSMGVIICPAILFLYRIAIMLSDKRNPKAFTFHVMSTSLYLVGWYLFAEILLNISS